MENYSGRKNMKRIAIYNPYLETKGGGEKVCLALAAALSQNNDNKVYLLTHNEVDITSLGQYFNIDLSRVNTRYIYSDGFLSKVLNRIPIPGKIRNFFFDVRVLKQIKKHRYDVFINNCYQSNLPNPSPKGIYMCMFPQKLRQTDNISLIKRVYYLLVDILYKIFLHPGHKNGIFSYDLITANSKYTQHYVNEYWHQDSDILYPICDDMSSQNIKKKNIILHVGRFFENSGENHHKRQDFLLNTFKKMSSLHKKGWELHFAGSVAEDVGALKYILSLIKEADGIPVFFHFNSSFKEIKTLYNEASIYWHATGFGSKVELHPEKQEHFGIATVEAMSTGAIPVVINAAGQKESVSNGVNGYLWDTQEELIEYTNTVALMGRSDLEKMQTSAKQSSKQYDATAFNKRVNEIVEKIN
jgi:glycosyltransferase involved in cell wall biosynthesis